MEEQTSFFDQIGGRETVEKLVNIFYNYMDQLPEVITIRRQHQQDLSEARWKLTLFLTGWLGGPQEYTARFGHPRLRARHLPFPIGINERDQWLLCMFKAIEDVSEIQEPVRSALQNSLARLADHMRNQPE